MSLTIQPTIDQAITQRYRAAEIFAIRAFHIISFISDLNIHLSCTAPSAHAPQHNYAFFRH